MKNIKAYLLVPLSIAFLFIWATGYGQCTIDATGSSSNSAQLGQTFGQPLILAQTFKACQDGNITQLTLQTGTPQGNVPLDFTLSFFSGNDPNNPGPLLHSQTVTIGPNTTFQTSLSTPVPVTNNSDYHFTLEIINPNALSVDFMDIPITTLTYSDGRYYDKFGPNPFFPASPSDNLAFTLTIAPAGPTTVPTLSEWGLILLGLIVVSIGTITVWRKKYTFSV